MNAPANTQPLEPPAYGNQDLRREWRSRAASFERLQDAVAALVSWRQERDLDVLTSSDGLWIEARLEERVAVLRFEELENARIREFTLTGERIEEVEQAFARRAREANAVELEGLAAEFRRRYKPPLMPSSPFLRTETQLSELLMKARSRNWFEPTIAELRRRRGALVRKEGLPESGGHK